MKAFIESLTLGTGAILIATISMAIVWILCSVLPVALRVFWVVVVPFVLAYSLYWLPVWLGADRSEYSTWSVLGIGVWFLAGFLPSTVMVLFLRRRATVQGKNGDADN